MRVVCAPNAFKGSLSAGDVAAALAEGVRDAGAEAVMVPVADGGDGTLDVLLAAAGARARVTPLTVTGPLGEPVVARLGWTGPHTAVVELAEAAGLRLLDPAHLDAVRATTFGAGELIAAALRDGARHVIVGVGGSATTDGGLGILQALGARFRDAGGGLIERGGLGEVAAADIAPARAALQGVSVEVAVDVDTPLCGDQGAAAVFAPQKGASPGQVAGLDAALRRYADLLEAESGAAGLAARPGMGAAGGSAFGLAIAGAVLRPGAALICDQAGLDAALAGADLLITGEGRLDAQTARGKAPAEVAVRSRRAGVPCVAVAGSIDDPLPTLFASAHSLGTAAGDSAATRHRLRHVAADIVRNMRAGSR